MTKVVNKHLLDVFDEPMIFFPIRTLAAAGIEDIVVVTGEYISQFKKLLGDGSQLGVKLEFAFQEGELGIAHALSRAEALAKDRPLVVILGDNIYQDDLAPFVDEYRRQGSGAKILLKESSLDDAKRFAVAELDGNVITDVIEKPQAPRSNMVVTGCYMVDETVFDLIRTLEPSGRGQYEITDVINLYRKRAELTHGVLKGWWTDAGTPPSKLKASILVALAKGVTFHR